ncbi:MAG: hypothetical protein AAF959_22740 [Cyanobacteria bacterium P01_D01_bin.56]
MAIVPIDMGGSDHPIGVCPRQWLYPKQWDCPHSSYFKQFIENS